MGLWLTGTIHQHGAWEDGGFYWQNAGFGDVNENFGERRGILRLMPRIFWSQVFVMGVSRGCAIFALDGQTLMFSQREADRWPERMPHAVIWDTTGKTTETFDRFVVPLMRGIVRHQLIPTREQVLENIRLAVFNDMRGEGDVEAWPYYVEYGPLYAGTYGFRRMGEIDGQLWEFFPNTGRYYFVPVLVQGDVPLAPHIRNVPVSQLQEVASVQRIFKDVYPQWYQGEALVARIGDTLTIQNTHENSDVTETFDVPLDPHGARSLAGSIGPFSYAVGKLYNGGDRLWLQANAEHATTQTALRLRWPHRPTWTIEPQKAGREELWNEQTRTLTIRLAHEHGAAEVTIE